MQLTAVIYGQFCGLVGNTPGLVRYCRDEPANEWLPRDDAPRAMED
jgi:hypothetical protein